MGITFICCTLPGRDISKLIKSAGNYRLEIFDDVKRGGYDDDSYKYIPKEYPTTVRYQLAYDSIKYLNPKYVMFIGDDCEFTPGFEEQMIAGIEEAIKITGDRRVCVYPDDGIHGVNLCTHPCFTREWIDALGYFFPQGAMRHCFVDRYIMDLGKAAKRIAYCESAKLIHHNYFKDKSIGMDSYQKAAYSKEFYEEDKRRYEYLVKTQLASDVAKLIA